MLMLQLRQPSERQLREEFSYFRDSVMYWKKCPPFFYNTNGYLLHRPLQAGTYCRMEDNPEDSQLAPQPRIMVPHHHFIHYYCGNQATFHYPWNRFGGIEAVFYDNPPLNKLLCEACERIAIQRGKPSADEITGRHVHVGKLRTHRTCCQEEATN